MEMLTRSRACSFSVLSSCFSNRFSSSHVGLKRGVSIIRGGAPGVRNALLSGDAGVSGISTP